MSEADASAMLITNSVYCSIKNHIPLLIPRGLICFCGSQPLSFAVWFYSKGWEAILAGLSSLFVPVGTPQESRIDLFK